MKTNYKKLLEDLCQDKEIKSALTLGMKIQHSMIYIYQISDNKECKLFPEGTLVIKASPQMGDPFVMLIDRKSFLQAVSDMNNKSQEEKQ